MAKTKAVRIPARPKGDPPRLIVYGAIEWDDREHIALVLDEIFSRVFHGDASTILTHHGIEGAEEIAVDVWENDMALNSEKVDHDYKGHYQYGELVVLFHRFVAPKAFTDFEGRPDESNSVIEWAVSRGFPVSFQVYREPVIERPPHGSGRKKPKPRAKALR